MQQTFDTATIISLLIGSVLPMLVAIVTKESWNATLKGVLLLLFSAVSSVLSQWLTALNNHQVFAWQAVVVGALVTFATGFLTHQGVWKPGGASNWVQRNVGVTDPKVGNVPAVEPYPQAA